MKRRDTVILVGMILAAGAAAFCVGRTAAPRQTTDVTNAQAQWLTGISPQAVQAEERFEQQTRQRMEEVRAKQAVLTSMLPDNHFTGAQILAQVDDIAQSYATLTRSVGGHMAQWRNTLPEVPRRQALQCCANSLRGCMQRRFRWRGGAQDQGPGFMGGGRGGWGRGGGYGRQYRGGRGGGPQDFAGRLRLTQEQATWIGQQDPNFEAECTVLRDRLYESHANLLANLENAQSTEQELTTRVEALIEAHNALEKRVARHIVLLRPQLTPPQLDQLCGLCCGGTRAAGIAVRAGSGPLGDLMTGLLSSPILGDLL